MVALEYRLWFIGHWSTAHCITSCFPLQESVSSLSQTFLNSTNGSKIIVSLINLSMNVIELKHSSNFCDFLCWQWAVLGAVIIPEIDSTDNHCSRQLSELFSLNVYPGIHDFLSFSHFCFVDHWLVFTKILYF